MGLSEVNKEKLFSNSKKGTTTEGVPVTAKGTENAELEMHTAYRQIGETENLEELQVETSLQKNDWRSSCWILQEMWEYGKKKRW